MSIDILFAAELHAEQASGDELRCGIQSPRTLHPHLNDHDHIYASRLIQKLARLPETLAEVA